MDCEPFLDRLGDESGARDPRTIDHLQGHLEACPRCRRIHDTLERGREILHSLPTVEVSADFFQTLQHRIEAIEERRRVRSHRIGKAVRLSAAAAVVVAAFWMVRGGLGRLPQPAPEVARSTFAGSDSRSEGAAPSAAATVEREEGALFARPAEHGVETLAEAVVHRLLVTGWKGGPGASTWSPGREGWQPVLYAAPSWTFTAHPTAFQFVSAPARSTFQAPFR